MKPLARWFSLVSIVFFGFNSLAVNESNLIWEFVDPSQVVADGQTRVVDLFQVLDLSQARGRLESLYFEGIGKGSVTIRVNGRPQAVITFTDESGEQLRGKKIGLRLGRLSSLDAQLAFGDVTLFRVAAVLSEGRHSGDGHPDGPDRPHPNPELDACILDREALAKELEILKGSELACHDPQMIVEIFGDGSCSYTNMIASPFDLTGNYASDLVKCLDLSKSVDVSTLNLGRLMSLKVNGKCNIVNATKDLTSLCLAASQQSIAPASPDLSIQAYGSTNCRDYELTKADDFKIFGVPEMDKAHCSAFAKKVAASSYYTYAFKINGVCKETKHTKVESELYSECLRFSKAHASSNP